VKEAVVHVRIADKEPFRFLVKGATEAAGMFAALTEEERDSLPDAALSGIARLRGAIAEFAGEEAPTAPHDVTGDTAGAAEAAPPYRGVIVIEWPAAAGTGPYACMIGAKVAISDAVTGKPVVTCSSADITVHADANALVTADLTLFADEDGEPVLDGEPVPDGEGSRTGTFPFVVAEMRVRTA
jgi:hypothetical protein